MKKMKTLFIREFLKNGGIFKTTDEVEPSCEWVLKGEGVATRKWDGTCTMYKDGCLWKRYDCKRGKPVPEGAILCQPEADAVTGHLPCWVKVTNEPCDKWFINAYIKALSEKYIEFEEGQTYELCGPHFNGNPEGFEEDIFKKHGADILEGVGRDYMCIRKYLHDNMIEGIVFHRGNGDMCKIKRTDFGFEWNNSKSKRK